MSQRFEYTIGSALFPVTTHVEQENEATKFKPPRFRITTRIGPYVVARESTSSREDARNKAENAHSHWSEIAATIVNHWDKR